MMTPSGFWITMLENVYTNLIRFYPPSFKDEFSEEMQSVFAERANRAARHGFLSLLHLTLEEIFFLPPLLIKAHWYQWQKIRSSKGISGEFAGDIISTANLHRQDGRDSWIQAFLEVSLFITLAVILILQTYLPIPGSGTGWARAVGFTGTAILILAAPIFLIGLLRGLPRWALPSAGILLGYGILMGWIYQLLLPFAVIAGFAIPLIIAAYRTSLHTRSLPSHWQRLWASLRTDWPQLSFGLYGATPLLIILAYGDAVLNNRTLFIAVSVFSMLTGAFVFTRSRKPATQLLALVGGLTLSLWPALLDQAFFNGGLWVWMAKTATWSGALGWMLALWGCSLALLCAPLLIRAAKPR